MFDHFHQFAVRRPKLRFSSALQKTLVTAQLFSGVADKFLDSLSSMSRLHHLIQQTFLKQIFRLGNDSAEDQSLRDVRSEFSREQAVGAHPWKQIKQHLREAQLRSMFRNHEVTGQCCFKAAAQGVTVDFGNADYPSVESRHHAVDGLDAKAGIFRHARPIVTQNGIPNVIQIAAQIVDMGGVRSQHIKIHFPRTAANVPVQFLHIAENRGGKAGPWADMHAVPDRQRDRIVGCGQRFRLKNNSRREIRPSEEFAHGGDEVTRRLSARHHHRQGLQVIAEVSRMTQAHLTTPLLVWSLRRMHA